MKKKKSSKKKFPLKYHPWTQAIEDGFRAEIRRLESDLAIARSSQLEGADIRIRLPRLENKLTQLEFKVRALEARNRKLVFEVRSLKRPEVSE